MAQLRIHGRTIDVDIERELGEFSWSRATWKTDRLIACSPFRYDSSPSFYVYLEDTPTATAGSWGDSGGVGDYRKGHFVTLLSFLRQETEQETFEYLLSQYSTEYDYEVAKTLDFSRLKKPYVESVSLDKTISEMLQYGVPGSNYLQKRGIIPAVQKLARVFEPNQYTVAIPWFNPRGELVNVKYRRTDSKVFFYEKGGQPIRELLWGIDIVHSRAVTRAVLVEAEIDAMYIMSHCSIAAIAVGTSKLSSEKVELIARSPIEELIVLGDNDDAGRELVEQTTRLLPVSLRLKIADLPSRYKDANDVKDTNILRDVIEKAKPYERRPVFS